MSRLKMIMLTVVVVFAFSGVVAGNAFAAVWLFEGKGVAEAKEVKVDSLLLLHHKFPAIIGGEITIHCTGSLDGTVNIEGRDETTKMLGSKGEGSKNDCEVAASTQSLCSVGTLVLVTALHLPWTTQLELEGTNVYDSVSKTGTKLQPGYETECKSLKVSCEGNEKAKFTENLAGGAMFEFAGELTSSCTDGGTGTLTGHTEVLGITISPPGAVAQVWLFEGKEVTEAREVKVASLLLLHHKFPAIIGGEITIHCTGSLDGRVNGAGFDKATKMLGSKGEESKNDCEVAASTQSLCSVGTLVLVTALHLPWGTQLELEGTNVYDSVSKAGYETECKSLKVSCEGNDRAKFTENLIEGAMFEFAGELISSCTDGGTGTLTGHTEVLGITVSTPGSVAPQVWLFEGKKVVEAREVKVDSLLLLHHKFPAIIGGEITIHCTGSLDGAVNGAGFDKTTKMLGSKGEETKNDCEVAASTQSLCSVGTLVLVTALHLPWTTQLELEGTSVFDSVSKTGTKLQPGYETECNSLKVSCERNERAKFTENLIEGAMFEFTGESTSSCSDGGTGTLTGHTEVLGITVSPG